MAVLNMFNGTCCITPDFISDPNIYDQRSGVLTVTESWNCMMMIIVITRYMICMNSSFWCSRTSNFLQNIICMNSWIVTLGTVEFVLKWYHCQIMVPVLVHVINVKSMQNVHYKAFLYGNCWLIAYLVVFILFMLK